MYQIFLKGCIETENPEEIVNAIQELVKSKSSDVVGRFEVYGLPPYVDYQKCND